MAGGEGFSGRRKSGADTSSACSVRDDQGCDSAPGAVAFKKRTDMDGDDAVEIALGVGQVGRAGRVVDPGLDVIDHAHPSTYPGPRWPGRPVQRA
jgi:hypothetical protein